MILKIFSPGKSKMRKIRTMEWVFKEPVLFYLKDLIIHLRNCLPIPKGKTIIKRWRNLVATIPTKWPKLTSLKIGQTNVMCLLMWYTEKGHITSVVFLAKMHYLNIIRRTYQTNSNWGTFYVITDLYLKKKKKSVSCKTKKSGRTVPDRRWLKRHNN